MIGTASVPWSAPKTAMRQCSWTSDPRCCASHFPLRRWSSSRPFLSQQPGESAHAAFALSRVRVVPGRGPVVPRIGCGVLFLTMIPIWALTRHLIRRPGARRGDASRVVGCPALLVADGDTGPGLRHPAPTGDCLDRFGDQGGVVANRAAQDQNGTALPGRHGLPTIPNCGCGNHRQTLKQVQAAPPRVFEAMTDPNQVAEWWGPEGFTCPEVTLDVRVGGA